MSTTITWGTQAVYPEMVTGYESARESGNVLHKVIGRADPDVTLRAAGLRTGSLEIWCSTHQVALDVEAMHAQAGVFHLTDTAFPGLGMHYVTSGRVELRQDGTRWLVRVEYAEVAQ